MKISNFKLCIKEEIVNRRNLKMNQLLEFLDKEVNKIIINMF